MAVKTTIAIIGATGQTGRMVSKKLAGTDHRLLLFDGDPESVRLLSEELKGINASVDLEGAMCPTDASWEADIIVTALPKTELLAALNKIKEVATQKPVVIFGTSRNGDCLSSCIPHSKIVYVYVEETSEVFIRGGKEEDLKLVADLLAGAGFTKIMTENTVA